MKRRTRWYTNVHDNKNLERIKEIKEVIALTKLSLKNEKQTFNFLLTWDTTDTLHTGIYNMPSRLLFHYTNLNF